MADEKPKLREAGEKDAKARDQALQAAVKQIEQNFGQGALMKLGDRGAMDVESISTGALPLDIAVDVVAVDSVAALTPRVELEGQMGDSHVGLQARLMSQALRKLAGNLSRAKTVCLFTNQIREKIGVMFGSPETQPGGRALKFYSSQRLDIRRIETLKEGTEAVGNRVRVKVVKNKVASPFRMAEFDIGYGTGISKEGSILDLALEHDLIQKSGSFFSYGDLRLGQGRNNSKGYLAEHPELAAELEGLIYERIGIDRPGPVPVEATSPQAEAAKGQKAAKKAQPKE